MYVRSHNETNTNKIAKKGAGEGKYHLLPNVISAKVIGMNSYFPYFLRKYYKH